MGLGLFAAILTLVLLIALLLRPGRGVAVASAGAMLVTVVAMLFVRDQVRASVLAGIGFEPTAWVVTQWEPLILFLVLLVGAITLVAWMAIVFFRATPIEKPHARIG